MSFNPIPTGCCHMTLIYGLIPPMAGRNRVKIRQLVLLSSVGNWSFSCCSNNIFHEKHFMINLYSEFTLKMWQNLVLFLTIFCQPLGQTQFVPFDLQKNWLYIRLIASFISVILHKE